MIRYILSFVALATPVTAQNTAEAQLAKEALEQLQAVSFERNREHCGYLIIGPNDELAVSDTVAGDAGSCLPPVIPTDVVIIASIHTHGAFDYDTPSEFPSVGDIEGDEAEGIDGYVSTPGGRLWYIDTTDMVVSQLCGIGCLSQDPRFEAGLDGDIKISYTYEEMLELEAQ
jgi:hypothetical protein